MKHTFLKIFALGVALFALGGCVNEEELIGGDGKISGDGKVSLLLFTSTPDYAVPAVRTRTGSAAESDIQAPWVLVFDTSSVYVEAAQAVNRAGKT